MNLIQQVEADLGSIGSELKAAWTALESGAKSIGAMVWADVQAVAGEVETTVVADIKKDLPALAQALEQYALTVVQNLESNATFGKVNGTWKFGIAAAQLFAAVSGGALGPVVNLGIATVETLIQDAYNKFVTQVKQVAPPIAAAAKATADATVSALQPPTK